MVRKFSMTGQYENILSKPIHSTILSLHTHNAETALQMLQHDKFMKSKSWYPKV